MLLALLSTLALGAPPEVPQAPVTLAGSIEGLVGPGSAGGGVGGRILWNAGPRWQVEAGAREGIASGETRSIGSIVVAGRYRFGPGLWAGAGFAHNHETPIALVAESPVPAIAGTLDGIEHRSGFHAGFGVMRPLPIIGKRWGATAQLGLDGFPDAASTPVYFTTEVGVSLDVGKLRG